MIKRHLWRTMITYIHLLHDIKLVDKSDPLTPIATPLYNLMLFVGLACFQTGYPAQSLPCVSHHTVLNNDARGLCTIIHLCSSSSKFHGTKTKENRWIIVSWAPNRPASSPRPQ